MRYVLSTDADHDFQEILEYTRDKFGFAKVEPYASRLIEAFEMITEFPESGTAQDMIVVGLRRLVVERHSIYYRTDGEQIVILRILGPGQDPLLAFSD